MSSSGAVGDSLWYFGYGSNMSRATFCDRRGMQPSAVRWGWIEGYRLAFDLPVGPGERGVANLQLDAGARVFGVLWRLEPADAERLDRTEGVHRGFYRRVHVNVSTPEGTPVAAFAYRSLWSVAGRKPSARYQALLLEGAREHGLPAEYVGFLEGLELAVDERVTAEPG